MRGRGLGRGGAGALPGGEAGGQGAALAVAVDHAGEVLASDSKLPGSPGNLPTSGKRFGLDRGIVTGHALKIRTNLEQCNKKRASLVHF